MKKNLIIFIILFIAALLIPLISIVQSNKQNSNKNSELVTIFSSNVTVEANYHLLFQDQILH